MNMEKKADIGLIGLGVMGRNLILNMDDHGFAVAAYNRTASKLEAFLDSLPDGHRVTGAASLEAFVSSLKPPRMIMLMVKAGNAVQQVVEQLVPYLAQGDIIIDGGNSNYLDSMKMASFLESKGFLYIGCGVSGGEEGARYGPSLMPGGSYAAWPHVKQIFQAIAAKVEDGTPCCDWVGNNGAGHFVKMVHNGIEYGDMQLISESYDLMRTVLRMTPDEMSTVFAKWNKGKLNSYLIEITADILGVKDSSGRPLIDSILDTAGQKGTGKWTAISAIDAGIPLTLIGEAVFSRFLSSLKDERSLAHKTLKGPDSPLTMNREVFLDDIEQALYASKIISYAQGYMLFRAESEENGWDLNYGGIALMWRDGCIIRAAFLDGIKEAFDRNPGLTNLLLDPYFSEAIQKAQQGLRRAVTVAVQSGISAPAMSSALSFYDGYRSNSLPANLLQAQRDYFGAHTYERIDSPRGKFFHTDWKASEDRG